MIIGITGTNGAGKGTVVEYLVQKGFKHYSISGEITEEVKRRQLPVDRPHMRLVGDDMRKIHGPQYYTELFLDWASRDGVENVLIDALRNSKEAENLQKRGGVLIAVDADRALRYERIFKRGGAKDHVTYEQFCEQEDKEATSAKEHEMDTKKVIVMADYTVENNGTFEELRAQVDAILEKLHGPETH